MTESKELKKLQDLILLKPTEIKYRVVDKKRREQYAKGKLQGIEKHINGKIGELLITVCHWNDWHGSLWVRIQKRDSSSNEISLDSGVIEELAEELNRIKQGRVLEKQGESK